MEAFLARPAFGRCWGSEQLVLDSPVLLQFFAAVALTFTEVYHLERATLDEALERFPADQSIVRRGYVPQSERAGARQLALAGCL